MAAEDARVRRFGRPVVALQIEIRGISVIAERLGDAAAERALALLIGILDGETRRSDMYARASRWRIEGLLPETAEQGVEPYVGRVRRLYDAAAGPALQLGLVIGAVCASAQLPPSASLAEAEAQMYADGRIPPLAHIDPSAGGQLTAVRVAESLRALDELRRAMLIDQKEYRAKRKQILDQL